MQMLIALAPLLVTYGPDFVAEILDLFNKPAPPTGNDFRALAAKYGSKTYAQYLAEAYAAAGIIPPPVALGVPVPAPGATEAVAAGSPTPGSVIGIVTAPPANP